ncbi:hypothetical protein K461DRAFT_42174 [Myriangium duriaei CBS 260.36]|uniref:Zn(2)-C6 fungal-type domain-containing protein n=1 Tax=Myriangium duriaei CBS 260.36 TaxID=1168546 RepID=A0A9P4ISF4_9PEZI|nr:hypothetical protein K461DRAFT_42174 [Myriangium duriaei CBS 260.36]
MSSGGTSSSDARDVPNQPQQPSKSRRAQVNVACERCRRRKQKCSGTRPSCEACVARRATCIYDTEPDVTRNGALKRKYNVLEDENANLRTLVDFLAHRPISEANTILQRLRSGEEVASIISYVQNGDIAEQTHLGGVHTILGALWSVHGPSGGWLNAQLGHLFPPLTTDSTTKPRDKRMMIDHLVSTAPTVSSTTPDPAFLRNGRALFPVKVTSLRAIHPLVDRRLHRIDASTWTAVPVDSIVVINLIQIYLSWHHTYYRFFDERLFLDDLASGGYNFCSPLLVNAICAFACCLSAQLDIEALGLRKLFLQEGNRLWEASSRIDSIVVLSAGSILFATNYICTDEKTALAQLYHGRQIAFRLGMFSHDSNTVVLPSDEMSAAFLQAKAVAAWGYYNICA